MAILLIDSYDSFTFNLKNLIQDSIKELEENNKENSISNDSYKNYEIITIHNDSYDLKNKTDLNDLNDLIINQIDCIIIGPGPGNPTFPSDIGIIPHILSNFNTVPILGICLGFQCMSYKSGDYDIKYLKNPVHGQIHKIKVENTNNFNTINKDITNSIDYNLFKDFPDQFDSVRYHSIYVEKKSDRLDSNNLIPLAYYIESDSDLIVKNENSNLNDNKKILMACKLNNLPHYGVQYHPESICSKNGKLLIKNFWEITKTFNSLNRFKDGYKTSIDVSNNSKFISSHFIKPLPLNYDIDSNKNSFINIEKKNFNYNFIDISDTLNKNFNNNVINLCDYLNQKMNNDENEIINDFVLLNSSSVPGRWSIIGLPTKNESDVITHSTEDLNTVRLNKWKSLENYEKNLNIDLTKFDCSIWKFISYYLNFYKFGPIIENNEILKNCPFVGGLVGFISYEEGQFLNYNKMNKLTATTNVPDLKLLFISRFIIYDNESNKSFLVSINENDLNWLKNFEIFLKNNSNIENKIIDNKKIFKDNIKIIYENEKDYESAFNKCQNHLSNGDSYELCYTTSTKIRLPNFIKSWDLYKLINHHNPSPYSSFIEFDDCKLLLNSPERFISWDNKMAQMRPIKGTVKNTPEITYAKAESLLKIPKEIGENLMIVDLIRHDLYNFLQKVKVPKLMTVEEYKTVYQLVSVIEGYFNDCSNDKSLNYTGLDLLSQSLPPGSMTGAPKKRSVELLQEIELNERRGIYSGVAGYFSLNGYGDWSVIIRSLFNYTDDILNSTDNDNNNNEYNYWRCGAGGALTVLSTCEGEWDEMNLKFNSATQIFKP
ncbi:catalytic activity protein [[Candida] boidinii]|nr:catalytic activity protein [[Candida] boidinii]